MVSERNSDHHASVEHTTEPDAHVGDLTFGVNLLGCRDALAVVSCLRGTDEKNMTDLSVRDSVVFFMRHPHMPAFLRELSSIGSQGIPDVMLQVHFYATHPPPCVWVKFETTLLQSALSGAMANMQVVPEIFASPAVAPAAVATTHPPSALLTEANVQRQQNVVPDGCSLPEAIREMLKNMAESDSNSRLQSVRFSIAPPSDSVAMMAAAAAQNQLPPLPGADIAYTRIENLNNYNRLVEQACFVHTTCGTAFLSSHFPLTAVQLQRHCRTRCLCAVGRRVAR